MVNYSFVISVLQMFKMIAIYGHYLSTYVPKYVSIWMVISIPGGCSWGWSGIAGCVGRTYLSTYAGFLPEYLNLIHDHLVISGINT